ncbi:MAG: hypothetical protein IJW20_05995 [Clostridia bacterium]|nr:hypothetical protein [Clostridia bacterium]
MKEILKCIGIGIIIILPFVLIFVTILVGNNYRHAVPVNDENREEIQALADSINLGVTLDENVKEIATVSASGDSIAYNRYEVVYQNNEVKEYETEVLADKGALSSYIYENSNDKIYYNISNILLISIPISIIASIYAIKNVGKSEKIY